MNMTDKQKELLQKLDYIICDIIEEIDSDFIFNDFIHKLGVFNWDSGDLREISKILIDNYEDE
jgi:hypothetical protein